jgi:cyclohexanone monooxygenase
MGLGVEFMAGSKDLRVAVIGAGPVGIAAGRELLEQGFANVTIFEKEDAVGGTWHMHSYPGLACDVKAHAYTFSCEPNPDWSANYVEQAEIEAYLQRSATRFGLDPLVRLNTKITRAEYRGNGEWRLSTEGGEQLDFDFVINAMGNQHTPIFPDIEGMGEFAGESWHATRWNHDVPLEGKRIAIVGSAASAVQIVPELAKLAGRLTVMQRSPNWILPRGRKPYSQRTRRLLRAFPSLVRLLRGAHEKVMNLSHGASQIGSKTMNTVENMGRSHMQKAISGEALIAALTPDQHFGCKRPLVSDDFYPALMRDNVTLIPSAASEVNAAGLVSCDGRQVDADVIIYCTGYQVLDFERIEVIGEEGVKLAEEMARAPEVFKGIAIPGFPNYFLGTGPNGVLLSASFFTAAEANVACIVKILKEKQEAGVKAIRVKPELHRRYNDWIAAEREQFSWGDPSCNSYYRTPSGHTPFLFPGDIKTFQRQRKEAGLHEYEQL